MARMRSTEYSQEQQQLMLQLVRAAIADQLELHFVPVETEQHEWLQQPAATFVTLTISGSLRGCIGSLEAHRSLLHDLKHNAVGAAFRDHRFSPLTRGEFHQINVHISVLTVPVLLLVDDEADLLAKLRPGIDGLLLDEGAHRATFLPQVWDQLHTPQEFVAHLKQKAGLDTHYWSDTIQFSAYQVADIKDHEGAIE